MSGFIGTYSQLQSVITAHTLNSFWTTSVWRTSLKNLSLTSDWSLLLPNLSLSDVTTDGQSASLSWNEAHIWGLSPDFYYCQTVAGLLIWVALSLSLSDERTDLPFGIAAGPRQGSHSRVRVPWYSRPYFAVSDFRLQFSSPLRLAGLRWRYSTPPLHGIILECTNQLVL
jgi:hypothetical protein